MKFQNIFEFINSSIDFNQISKDECFNKFDNYLTQIIVNKALSEDYNHYIDFAMQKKYAQIIRDYLSEINSFDEFVNKIKDNRLYKDEFWNNDIYYFFDDFIRKFLYIELQLNDFSDTILMRNKFNKIVDEYHSYIDEFELLTDFFIQYKN